MPPSWITEAEHGHWRLELIGGRRCRYGADWGSQGRAIASDFTRIYLVHAGCGEVVERGRRITLRPTRCYCFSPDLHRLYSCTGDFDLAWLHARLLLEPGLDVIGGLLESCERQAGEQDHEDMASILASLSDAGPEAALLRTARLARLMAGFLRPDWPDHERMRAARRFRAVLDYMQAHLTDAVRLEDLAALQGWHPTWFSNRFSAVFGCGPMRWLAQQRLARAQELLRSSEASVSEVAGRCGFDDPAYFSRAFKRRYGIAPSQVRTLPMDG